ncbi:cytochrome P450 [Aquihabitans sp. McL0605]|uniref:cytochrome P450 n=1 Tax=Aquihabitans sp. McL0605 TaxID=3415671 RepID=UPI003CF8ADAC
MTRPTAPDLTAPLVDESFYAGDPFPLYAQLREQAPIVWHQPDEGGGWWVVSTQPEVLEVSRDPERFCSAKGILTLEIGIEYPSPPTMMHTDPPDHTRYRKLVQPGFSPSRMRALEEPIRALARRLLDELPTGEVVDIVPALAEPYPVHVIADLLGIPDADRDRFVLWSDATIPGASDMSFERCMELMAEMQTYLMEAGRSRRGGQGTDLISVLANVEVDGEVLTDDELLMFFNQLLVAGNETTRNMISGGLWALADDPEQWARLVADPTLIPGCVEEWLRWTTPVVAFMRTATGATELRGQAIAEGDPVLLLYAAANRDREVFGDDAESFRIDRTPNPHVSLGFGPHFCIGAALARLEGRVLLEEMVARWSSLAPAGEVQRTGSAIIAGLKHAPVVLGA